jgi:hypothetical protein
VESRCFPRVTCFCVFDLGDLRGFGWVVGDADVVDFPASVAVSLEDFFCYLCGVVVKRDFECVSDPEIAVDVVVLYVSY